MKPYERRAAGAYPYFRLAKWDAVRLCWTQLPGTFATKAEAANAAREPGKYRIGTVTEDGQRFEDEGFEVA